jgi:succinate-semialdehyde dehydrogenase/glutarate-semialdehyde dehydrogenase
MSQRPFESAVLIGGEWVPTGARLEVHDKFDGTVVGTVGRATREVTERAVAAAQAAFRSTPFPAYRRYEVLSQAARLLEQRRAEVLGTMVAESGFTASDCANEFARCLQTLALSAEEAKRITGEIIPVQGAPGQDDRKLAFTVRMPVGVVCAITPFNAPLNTVAHKIAPALAAGNSVVLKPASYVPMTAALLCQVLVEAGVPPGYLSCVFGGSDVGTWLLEDPRVRFYTFTGSTEVGRIIQRHAGLRRTQLELGNISATIVCADAKLAVAAEKCVGASFRKAGQVCTSVQRILVERSVLPAFADELLARTRGLKAGDPRAKDTFVGPMIAEKEAVRAESWVREAAGAGARLLVGGRRERAVLEPTILADVTPAMKVVAEEIFAPVISLVPFDTFDEAVAVANDTPFGLAVGLFTSDLTRALEAVRRLEMGSIHVNDTSSSRVDLMPYGGIKDSGFGQEGPRYAIRDMTEERLVTFNPV